MQRSNTVRARLLCGAAAVAMALPLSAHAQAAEFNIAAQPLTSALKEFGVQSQYTVVAQPDVVASKTSRGISQSAEPEVALAALLDGTGLSWRREGDTFLIVRASDPQSGSAAGDGAEGTVEALIVTAQKREEDIQDVPIAISAFTQEQLDRSQVAGGPDLMTQVPNMTFTKTNFSSYSIQLRGIGTQAISATVDPAVAVAFNNTPFIKNRFFEQEFYDLQRVEVLRGPQGTLYGRNATAGVVNLISNKPKLDTYEANLSADVANYNSTRLAGMINIPLAEDVAALRIAGAWTKREGYAVNEVTGNPIDGRDLWSTRLSLRFAPTDRLDVNLIWEHFEEDDDRIRSGKQLCKSHLVEEVAGIPTPDFYQTLPEYGLSQFFSGVQASFSQGCLPSSLYSPDSFEKPNGWSLPFFVPLGAVGLPVASQPGFPGRPVNPYASLEQSRDLRVIESTVDPSYRAKADVVELQFAYDLTDTLTLNSETAWSSDWIFSTQDYNRFATIAGAWRQPTAFERREGVLLQGPNGGIFCDPQIGCADRMVAMDLSTARSSQFSQELRLASDFDGAFNFSLGGNFLRYGTEDKYYVFINSLSMITAIWGPPQYPYVAGQTDNLECMPFGFIEPDPTVGQDVINCVYMDPNPVTSLNDLGHNYFLSKNPFKLISYAVFGEAYYNITDTLKLTAGLRWTVDKKEAPRIPSWVLAARTAGYPVTDVVEQEWRKPTGRLTLDWKPDLAFTDETMVYASYAHGYKAGGMNPPPFGPAFYGAGYGDLGKAVAAASATHPRSFDPEYVDAFELGAKNTLLDGSLTMNLAAFYYDYKGYQLSQIVNRSAVTHNYDAEVMGLELEADWRAAENLRLGLKFGWENTKVADGERAIDVMDRVAGTPGWVVTKPFPSVPSNCVLPEWLFIGNSAANPQLVNVGGKGGGNPGGCELAYMLDRDPATGAAYVPNPYVGPVDKAGEAFRRNIDYPAWSTDPADYPCWPAGVPITQRNYPGVDPACLQALSNNGEGFFKDLSGNELPNAPDFTATITADYTIPLPNDWLATLHTDLYMQSEAWTRIFNMEGYDKLKAYTNVNLAAIFTNEEAGWKVMAYVKNVFDRDSITGAFLNSDDTGLTTNVFLTEPRLYGLRVTKDFAGGPWWTGANLDHEGPYPLIVELGGQLLQTDAPYEKIQASWIDTLGDNAPGPVDNRDFDWGDGRSLKATWRPEGTPWSISAGMRYGRTNNDTARSHVQSQEDIEACWVGPPYEFVCGTYIPAYWGIVRTTNWADAESSSREQHQIIDFAVGSDVGIGGMQSHVSAGIRYADFSSSTRWAGAAQGNWDVPPGWGFALYPVLDPSKYASLSKFRGELLVERDFRGTGPVLSWDAAVALLGDQDTGEVKLDWSITGGALFGKTDFRGQGEDRELAYEGKLDAGYSLDFTHMAARAVGGVPDEIVTPVSIPARSSDVTVPVVDLSLGLSYEVGRIKLGAGYRWERYFDVLDVGFTEEQNADRTIDGPYFKLAVGFGG